MGFKDMMKNVSDLAKDSYSSIQNDLALKKEEQQRLRDEMNKRINDYTNDINSRLLANPSLTDAPFIKIDDDTLVAFTKEFFTKLLLPANSSAASKIDMHPFEEKILKNITKTFPGYQLSEHFLFQFKDLKGQIVLVTTSNVYFKISIPDNPSFYSIGSIPQEKLFDLSIRRDDEQFKLCINNVTLISSPSTDVQKFDYITLSDYINRIKKHDLTITEDQIDGFIRTKLDNNILEIIQKYVYADEKIVFFAWGLDKNTAKDFVVCTNKQILMLNRELLESAKNIKQLHYEDITSVSTQKSTVDFLDFSLTVGLKPNDIQIFVAGTTESINTLYSREAERVVQIYQQYKNNICEEEIQVEVIIQKPATPEENPLELLEKLAVLKEKGILSEEEFNQKKKELLAKL